MAPIPALAAGPRRLAANAQILAGVLRTNKTLESLTLAEECKMSDMAQSVVGRALLNNSESRVAFLAAAGRPPPRGTRPLFYLA